MTGPSPLFDRPVQRRWLVRQAAGISAGDFLRKLVAADLALRLTVVRRHFPRALVMGAGSVPAAAPLLATGQIGQLLVAEPVAALATPRADLIADSEALPFAEASFDLVVSLLDLQLVNDLPGALVQARRILAPDGLLLAALIGGNSLPELAGALATAESEVRGGASPRVVPMIDVRDLGQLLQRAGFALPVTDVDRLDLTYASPLAVMGDLRALGLANSLTARSRRPLTRAILARALEAYAEAAPAPDGRVRATLEILTATAWAPHPDQQRPLRPGSARARLANALGVPERKTGD